MLFQEATAPAQGGSSGPADMSGQMEAQIASLKAELAAAREEMAHASSTSAASDAQLADIKAEVQIQKSQSRQSSPSSRTHSGRRGNRNIPTTAEEMNALKNSVNATSDEAAQSEKLERTIRHLDMENRKLKRKLEQAALQV